MKYLLYELTEDFDIIIKFTFYKHNMLQDFIKMHTEEKNYEPRFLVLELNDDIREDVGKSLRNFSTRAHQRIFKECSESGIYFDDVTLHGSCRVTRY